MSHCNSMGMPPKISIGIRPMLKADLKDVVRIERHSTGERWCMDDFSKRVGSKKFTTLVATTGREVLGYASFREFGSPEGGWHVTLERVAVDKDYRRHGIGSQILWAIIDKCAAMRGFNGIEMIVGERELGQQLFLKSCGFHCVKIASYDDGGDDGFIFELQMAGDE